MFYEFASEFAASFSLVPFSIYYYNECLAALLASIFYEMV